MAERESWREWFMDKLMWLWNQLDTLLGLVAAAICVSLSLTGKLEDDTRTAAVLGVLTILAFALLRERAGRARLTSQITDLRNAIEAPFPDAFLEYGSDERPLLRNASREAWLVQETGLLVTEQARPEIVSLLKRGGSVHMTVTAFNENIARLLAFRNANLHHAALKQRALLFRNHITNVIDEAGEAAETLQVRYVPYPVGLTCVVVDPSDHIAAKRRARIRDAGFCVSYPNKPDFLLVSATAPRSFDHYYHESKRYFLNASKIVLLTGEARSGKTTLLDRLVESIQDRTHLYFVLSKATWANKERTGFEAHTSQSPAPRRFAERQANGTYTFDPAVWASIGREIREATLAGKVVIVDEIGPLQLQEPTFQKLVDDLFDDPAVTLFASAALKSPNNDPYLTSLRRHYRCSVHHLKKGKNEQQVFDKLCEEAYASLRVAKFIPRKLWGNAQ